MRLVVVTWNIHKGIGGVDRRYRPERVTEVLRHHRPDLVLLQEVDEGARRSRRDRQVDLIGDTLGLRHRCYGITHRLRWEGHYGNAILSRWPLYDIHYIDLTIGARKRRGAVLARARVRRTGRARTVGVYNLHLGLAGLERGQQLERGLGAASFLGLHRRMPLILGGDLNDVWGTLGPAFLEPAGFYRAGNPANTFPAAMPLRPLDALFVRGDIEVNRCGPSRLSLAKLASDHLPLVAELAL